MPNVMGQVTQNIVCLGSMDKVSARTMEPMRMRITQIRYATHLGHQFKAHWLIKRKVKVGKTMGVYIAEEMGLNVVDPETCIRPALIEEPYNPPSPIEVVDECPPRYIFHKKTSLIEQLNQAQLITNSLVFDRLPEAIQNKVIQPTEDDVNLLSEVLLKSHILDATQDKLPHILDVINEPGYNPLTKYGIKPPRLIKNLLYAIFLDKNQSSQYEDDDKLIVQDPYLSVSVNHPEYPLNFSYPNVMIVFGKKPLRPHLGTQEVQLRSEEATMPDISPFSPFVHVRLSNSYKEREGYSSPEGTNIYLGTSFAPTTVIADFISIRDPFSEKQFLSCALLHCFANAALYAKVINKDSNGDLETPITLNLIHTNGRLLQVSCFQLNTLNLTGRTKNFFWYHPWDTFFSKISFVHAKPTIEGLNTKPLALIRAVA